MHVWSQSWPSYHGFELQRRQSSRTKYRELDTNNAWRADSFSLACLCQNLESEEKAYVIAHYPANVSITNLSCSKTFRQETRRNHYVLNFRYAHFDGANGTIFSSTLVWTTILYTVSLNVASTPAITFEIFAILSHLTASFVETSLTPFLKMYWMCCHMPPQDRLSQFYSFQDIECVVFIKHGYTIAIFHDVFSLG